MKSRTDITFDGNLKTLDKYNIGVGTGYSTSDEFDEADYLNKISVSTTPQLLKMLWLKRIDLVVGGLEYSKYYLDEIDKDIKFKGIKDDIIIMNPTLKERDTYLIISKKANKAEQKHKDFNIGMMKIMQDGRYKKNHREIKMNALNLKTQKKLSIKLLLIIIIISSSFTLLVSIYQMYFNYKKDLSEINTNIDSLMKSYLPAITSSVYMFDNEQTITLLEGLLNNSDIIFIEISDFSDKQNISIGNKNLKKERTKEYELNYELPNGKITAIGKIIIYTNLEKIYDNLKWETIIILISNIIKILIISILILFVINKILIQHLHQIYNFTSTLNLKNIRQKKLSLNRKGLVHDELDIMVESINMMLSNIKNDAELIKDMNIEIIENEKLLKKIAENFPNSYISIVNSDYTIGFASGKEFKNQNLDPNDLIGLHIKDVFGEKTDIIKKYCKQTFDGNETSFELYINDQYQLYHMIPLISDTGEICSILVVTENITEQKKQKREIIKAKERAEESETRFKALHNASFGGIALHDKGIILDCNKGLSEITGFTYDELIGMNGLLLIAKNNRDHVMSQIQKGYEKPYEATGVKKNGEEYPLRLEARNIPYKGKQVRTVEFRDITEKKKTELELLKMEKLRSIGTLAGGIAHDFNNILTGIYGNISLARIKLEEEKEKHLSYSYLVKAEKSIDRATKLTKQLLTFSKGGSPVKKDVNLGKIIKETVLFDLSGSNLKPVFNFTENLFNANVDEGQIQQVFSNLTINANQASPDGGHLYISIVNSFVNDNEILDLNSGEYLKITVEDEGTGIPKKYIDKIFDPYFTTKQTGNGLGLATTYSIIKRHKGHLEIVSEVGKGTKFTIYLPVLKKKQIKKETDSTIINQNQNITAKILIMDDDESIREILSQMIMILGYDTDSVPDGETAVKKYKDSIKQKTPFDIIIMDLTIPGGMGGKEAVKEVLKINKDAKVIVSSGYAGGLTLADYESFGFIDMINKPYTIAKLKEVLDRVLNDAIL